MDSIFSVQPENMLAVGRGGDAIDDTNDFSGLYVMPGEKPLTMDWTNVYINQEPVGLGNNLLR